jgi:hypothetical protein
LRGEGDVKTTQSDLAIHLFDLGHQGDVDLTLIRKMLRMTPTERARYHDRCRAILLGRKVEEMLMEDIVRRLVAENVEFVVVGMMSATLQGCSRSTVDLDLCYRRSPANIARLVTALKPLKPRPRGFPEDLPFVFDERTVQLGSNFTLEIGVESLDLLGEMSGIGGYEQVIGRTVEVTYGSVAVRALALEDLIRTKTAAGRARDIAALPELQALLREKQRADPTDKPAEG